MLEPPNSPSRSAPPAAEPAGPSSLPALSPQELLADVHRRALELLRGAEEIFKERPVGAHGTQVLRRSYHDHFLLAVRETPERRGVGGLTFCESIVGQLCDSRLSLTLPGVDNRDWPFISLYVNDEPVLAGKIVPQDAELRVEIAAGHINKLALVHEQLKNVREILEHGESDRRLK